MDCSISPMTRAYDTSTVWPTIIPPRLVIFHRDYYPGTSTPRDFLPSHPHVPVCSCHLPAFERQRASSSSVKTKLDFETSKMFVRAITLTSENTREDMMSSDWPFLRTALANQRMWWRTRPESESRRRTACWFWEGCFRCHSMVLWRLEMI